MTGRLRANQCGSPDTGVSEQFEFLGYLSNRHFRANFFTVFLRKMCEIQSGHLIETYWLDFAPLLRAFNNRFNVRVFVAVAASSSARPFFDLEYDPFVVMKLAGVFV